MGRARSSGSSRSSLAPRTTTTTRSAAPAPAPAAAPAAHHSNTPAAAPHHPPAPAAAPAAPPAIQVEHKGPGLLGSIVQGFMFGTGSAVANRAVDAVLGPRTIVHEHKNEEAAPAPVPPAATPAAAGAFNTGSMPQCNAEFSQYQRCLEINNNDMEACRSYFDMLASCQRRL